MISQFIDESYAQQLDDGLVLRFATIDDIEPLAQFNGRIHSSPFVAQWTREFTSPSHPTCGPSNVTLVEDTRTQQIVSSMCLIPQTWTYAGIEFPVGRPEAVGTDPAYRRRGLVRAQFDVLHAKSDAAGHLVQGITGIPWYYRQFGYEYALELDGGRWVYPTLIPALKPAEVEAHRLRPMSIDDLPVVMPLYDRQCARSLVACPRAEWLWRRMLLDTSPDSAIHLSFHIIETNEGHAVGYIATSRELWGMQYQIHELNVSEGQSMRAVLPPVLRWLKPTAEAEAAAQHKDQHVLCFKFGQAHPAFDAAPDLFHKMHPAYAWYMRVPDVAAFLQRITPVLEDRLAQSPLAGHTGELRVSEYVRGFQLKFGRGKIAAETWQPDDGRYAMFPPYTFLQLLFGRRSLSDLCYMYPDCRMEDEAAVLLDVLFPRHSSNVLPMG